MITNYLSLWVIVMERYIDNSRFKLRGEQVNRCSVYA